MDNGLKNADDLLRGIFSHMGNVGLVDAVLWGIILLSAALPWLGLSFLSAERHVELLNPKPHSPGPADGDLFQVSLTLRNRALWPGYFLGMFYDCPAAAPDNHRQQFFVTEITRRGNVSLESKVEAYRRGMHQLGPLVVESSAPFGLFRRRAKLTGSYPLLVYPKVYPLRRLAWACGLSGSAPQSRKSRTGTDPVGSRKYVLGDPRRLVHWRNTARTGQLMVKEVEDTLDRTLYLAFDATQVWGEGKDTTLEYGIKIIASAVDYAQRNQIPVKLLVLQRRFKEGCAGRHEVRRGAWHGSAWPVRYYPASLPATAATQPARTVPWAAIPAPPGRPAAS